MPPNSRLSDSPAAYIERDGYGYASDIQRQHSPHGQHQHQQHQHQQHQQHPQQQHHRWTSDTPRQPTIPSAIPSTADHRFSHLGPRPAPDYYYDSPRQRPLIDQVTNEWRKSPHYTRYQSDDYEEDEYGQLLHLTHKARSRSRHGSWTSHLSDLSADPRRAARYLGLYVVFLLGFLWMWNTSWSPGSLTISSTSAYSTPPRVLSEEELLDLSMDRANGPGRQYGLNARPEFADLKQVGYLESEYVPGASHASRKRIIAIGDVHGCKTELEDLLAKVKFDEKTDHLVLVGDIVNKGPDSAGVIDLAQRLGASCVRGNHDDRTILAYHSLHKQDTQSPEDAAAAARLNEAALALAASSHTTSRVDKDGNNVVRRRGLLSSLTSSPPPDKPAPKAQKAPNHAPGGQHIALARTLSASQIAWLSSCPCILNIGPLGGRSSSAKEPDYVVVHAGLAPGIRLERQDPSHVMNMRSIDLATRVPSAEHPDSHLRNKPQPQGGGYVGTLGYVAPPRPRGQLEPWSTVWNHHQRHLASGVPRKTVIYGHDAKRGLSIQRYTKGLDSGCVGGGELSALVLEQGGKERLVSVGCGDYLGEKKGASKKKQKKKADKKDKDRKERGREG